jgi:hypothetical protein
VEQSDGHRYVPDVGDVGRFPASSVNVTVAQRVPSSTATQVWIGIAWVLGVLALLGIGFLVVIVASAPRP